ncbi:hypothetical protein RCO27_08425 [Sphingosinicella sp. LHD-64]|nr:hypothetical protein [Sphingosinicella sp. LHD-64]MDQ8756255.1 hypothetical protein [Sphingosinicella sp. LHD-64]
MSTSTFVIPAKHVLSDAAGGVEGAGIQTDSDWTPAFAGVMGSWS